MEQVLLYFILQVRSAVLLTPLRSLIELRKVRGGEEKGRI